MAQKVNVHPTIFKHKKSSLAAFQQILSEPETVRGTTVPPLENSGIILEGLGKSGKTSLVAGNPRLIILKCYDGMIAVPRLRAKVINCQSLEVLDRKVEMLLKIADAEGPDAAYCQVAFDPISTVVRWHADRAVATFNKKKYCNEDGSIIPAFKGKLLSSANEIEGYGPWNAIADKIERMVISFGERGWGWIVPIHYQWKAESGFTGGMSWKPNIPTTTADRLSKNADIIVCTERDEETFVARYHSKATQNLGARVPLVGYTELPNYFDDSTPPDVSSWDYFRADYLEACAMFKKDQDRFEKMYHHVMRA